MSDKGPQILVVEDNYVMAKMVCDLVLDCGFGIAGAVGRVDSGERFLSENKVDGAIVDIDLSGNPSFPICEALARRKIPFFFLTAFERAAIPDVFRGTRLLTKPVEIQDFRSALTSLAPDRPLALDRYSRSSPPAMARGNLLLEQIGEVAWEAISPRLVRVCLERNALLEEQGRVSSYVHLPASGLLSVEARADGRLIEVASIGREGMVGASALLGGLPAVNDVSVRWPGEAWQIDVALFHQLLPSHADLREAVFASINKMIGEISRTLVMVGHATVDQRLARWLWTASDRTGSDRLRVTHEALARALGVRRPSITVALHALESEGAIKSMRGLVRIVGREHLLRLSEFSRGTAPL
jgi:CRP-like cAMP-binding protein/CheY-like chemotaxis protein